MKETKEIISERAKPQIADCKHKEIPMKIFKIGNKTFCQSCYLKYTKDNTNDFNRGVK